jgi:hypothetical protein
MDDDSAPKRPDGNAKAGAAPKSASDVRRERLAAQLRANLKRRKQQVRGRNDAGVGRD